MAQTTSHAAAGAGREPAVDRDAQFVLSWENRAADSFGLSPIATGALIFSLLTALFLLVQWLLGAHIFNAALDADPGLSRSARLSFLVVALIGFSAGANLYLPRAIWRDQVESFVADPVRRRELFERDALRVPRSTVRRSRWAGVAGLAASIGVLFLTSTGAPGSGDREWLFVALLTPVLFWQLARSAFQTLFGSRDFVVPEEFDAEVDLFDLRPHYCNGRNGLRLALVWLTGTAISLSILMSTGLNVVTLALVLGGIVIGAVAFLLPVRGLQHRIHEKRHAALAALQPELNRALEAHRENRTEHAGQLADLLALRAHLEHVREWPFDNSTLWRFALYTLIPLGSWVGGALVERLLEVALR